MSSELVMFTQDTELAPVPLPLKAKLPWHQYDHLHMEVQVLLPMHQIALVNLARIVPGTIFSTLHNASDDIFLYVDRVFVAHGAFEPAEGKLGLRINELSLEEPPQTGCVQVSNLAQVGNDFPPSLSHAEVQVPLALCFGRKSWTLGEALSISPGELIPLDRGLDGLVDLTTDGRTIASGTLLLIEGCYALEIKADAPVTDSVIELPLRKVSQRPSRVLSSPPSSSLAAEI